jgi:hypothetical protein
MGNVTINCYKGVAAGDMRAYALSPDMLLSDVRTIITNDGFLTPDRSDSTFRFVAMQSVSSEPQDSIIARDSEPLIPLKGVLRNGSTLVCTNVNATRHPDLIGIPTSRFTDGNLGVQIWINNNDEEARAANRSAGAGRLMMLTNVKPPSTRVTGLYDNVCVCVDGSVVGFNLSSWGAAGFQYFIGPDQGEPIVNANLNICYWNEPNRFATASIWRYSAKPQSIQIRATSSLGLSGAETVRYQKVTFKTRSIRSYSQDGKVYRSDQAPPPPPARGGFQPFSAATNVATVPGGAITPGAPVPGPTSGQQFGKPIYDIVTDDWSRALGQVVVYFFVFPTWQLAETVIRAINGDPNKHATM